MQRITITGEIQKNSGEEFTEEEKDNVIETIVEFIESHGLNITAAFNTDAL